MGQSRRVSQGGHSLICIKIELRRSCILTANGQWLSERLGQQFVIENRPGAGGNIGTEAVVRAPADGYTLLVIDVSPAINATLFDKLNFDFIRDIAPVASVLRGPSVLVGRLPSATKK